MLIRTLGAKSFFTVAIAVLLGGAAFAAGYGRPYEAVLESYSTGAPTRTHIWNDGQGHQRAETSISGVNRVSISDFAKKTIYAIDDQRRTITVMSMNPANSEQPDPSVKWTPLGPKVIDGHPCQGKRGTISGQQVEMWEGTDVGCNVAVVTNGKTTQKLVNWKPLAANPGLFSLPAGYKQVDMNALMRGFTAGASYDPSKMSPSAVSPSKFDPAAIQKMYQRPSTDDSND